MSNDGTAPKCGADTDFCVNEKRIEELVEWGNKHLNLEQAIRLFAIHRLEAEVLSGLLDEYREAQKVLTSLCNEQIAGRQESLEHLKHMADTLGTASEMIPRAAQEGFKEAKKQAAIKASTRGQKAAQARHSKPGGSRSKADAIRAAWASGKYSSRDVCAEQECAHLDMSFSAARRALRNTPGPA